MAIASTTLIILTGTAYLWSPDRLTLDDQRTFSHKEQYEALVEEYDSTFAVYLKLAESARTPEQIEALQSHPGADRKAFTKRFSELAQANPDSEIFEDCLIWICSHEVNNPLAEWAERVLANRFATSDKLAPVLGHIGHYSRVDPFEGSEHLLRAVMNTTPHRELRGLATYWIACLLVNRAMVVQVAHENPDYSNQPNIGYFEDLYGEGYVERLLAQDAEQLRDEADEHFERVARFYSEIPHNDKRRLPGTLGEAAGSYLRESRVLGIDQQALEIIGTDLDGYAIRLSDFQGQVVLLDFCSHFYCGACRQIYPKIQAMLEKYHDRTFAVISINSEPEKDLEALPQAWAEEGNSWPCLFDGTWEGPIQTMWNIKNFPTFYLIDDQGVIRYKSIRETKLEEQVEALLDEVEG